MNSIERVKKAIHFKGPDRVPIVAIVSPNNDFGLLIELPPKDWNAPDGYFPYVNGDFFIKVGLWKPTKRYPKNWMDEPHVSMDEWGTVWELDGGKHSSLGQAREPAIADWKDLESWNPPDPHEKTRFQTQNSAKKMSSNKYVLGIMQYFGFTRLTFLRGFENLMLDFYDHPDEVKALMRKVTAYNLGLVDVYHKLGASAVWACDDLGSQESLLISPDTFDNFFAEHYSQIAKRTHELGMDLWLHSCGRVNSLLPNLIEAGVDLFEFDSPSHTGIEEVADEFGGKVAFAGGPDIQGCFINDDPAGVEDFIKRMIKNYGGHNGGFIYYEYPEWKILSIPLENVKAAMDAVIKWGKYPLNWD